MLLLFMDMIDNEEDNTKFHTLYEKYHYLMYYVANNILKDKELTEDAVQEAFIRIAKNIYKIHNPYSGESKQFVVTVVRNVALTILKERGKFQMEEYEEELDDGKDLEEEVIRKEMMRKMVEEIRKLPQKYKDILYLKYYNELSVSEIASTLKISTESVKKRLQRGRAIVLENLKKVGFDNAR